MLRTPHRQLILATSLVSTIMACSPKPQPIAYLSPLDRQQEGFLDASTYQIISYGMALDLTKPVDTKTTFFPPSVGESFDQEEFQKYNEELRPALRARKKVNGIPFTEVMAAEANQLNPQEINLAVIDEKIRAPMEIKRALFDNACTNARILGLYRWLLSDATHMKLVHGASLPQEGVAKAGLDSRFYPPRAYYVAESAAILKDLEHAMAKKKFRYEVVTEVFSKPQQLECKVALHIHRNRLQVDMPFLVPL